MLFLGFVSVYKILMSRVHVPIFECRAKVSIQNQTTLSSKHLDFFISMNEKNKGYILVTASSAEERKDISRVVYFNYTKEGNYYSLHLKKREPILESLLWILKYDDVKIKIVPVSAPDYILSSPMETILLCTATG
ncbi:hypothetical protein AB1287_00865 [Enterobacter asburiae]|uniref:hypothetical protein n=1 Tax=Scandinavium sp. UTDF21-P1B TaxID=3446379 RepID=UPI0034822852